MEVLINSPQSFSGVRSSMNLKIFSKCLGISVFLILLILFSHNIRETNPQKKEQDSVAWKLQLSTELLYFQV